MDDTFNEILEQALRLGVIDIFTVITWQVNGIHSNQIVGELAELLATAAEAL